MLDELLVRAEMELHLGIKLANMFAIASGSSVMGVVLTETTAVHFLLRLLPSGVLRIAVIPNYWSLTLWETIHTTTKA